MRLRLKTNLLRYSEDDIVRLIRDAKMRSKGFSLFVYQYQERLYWSMRRILIVHEDTDDVLQEALLKVWSKLETFKFESSIYTWVYRICLNEALSFLRRKRRVLFLPLLNVEKEMQQYIEQPGVFTGSEIEFKFQQALLTLPERQRLVFNLRYYDDLSFKEIAAFLKLSDGGVKSTYHIAAKKMKEILAAD